MATPGSIASRFAEPQDNGGIASRFAAPSDSIASRFAQPDSGSIAARFATTQPQSQSEQTSPTLWQRIQNVVEGANSFLGTSAPGDTWSNLFHHPIKYFEHAPGYAEQLATKPILNVSNAMTSTEKQAHPVAAGVADFASGLTTPSNAAMLGVAGGLTDFAGSLIGDSKLAARLAAAGFSASSVPGLIQGAKDYLAAKRAGNDAQAEEIATKTGLGAALSFLTAHFAATGRAVPFTAERETAPTTEKAEAQPKAEEKPMLGETKTGKVIPPRGPVTIPQLQQAAAELGIKPEDVFERAAGSPVNAEHVLAGSQAMRGAFQDLRSKFDNLDLDTDEGKQAAKSALRDYMELRDQVHGKLFGEAGRALRAARENREYEGAASALAKAVGSLDHLSPENQDEFLKLTQTLTKADDATATAQFARDVENLKPTSTADKLHEMWMNSILSGASVPKKLLGDGITAMLSPFEEGLATAMRERSLSTGAETALRYAQGMYFAIPEAYANAFKVFGDDISSLDDVEQAGINATHVPALKGKAGELIRLPSRGLAATGSFFHTLHFSASLWTQALEQARDEGQEGSAMLERAQELRRSPTAEMRDRAENLASDRTYIRAQQTEMGKWISSAPRTKWARKIIPFANVPLNLIRVSLEFSPFGILKTGGKMLADSDFAGSPEMYREAARNAFGLMTGLWAYAMGRSGLMTGAENSKKLGPPSFAIKLPNGQWISYKYLTPVAVGLAAAAGYGESERQSPGDETKAIGDAMNSFMESAGGLPVLSSITFLVNHMTWAIQAASQRGESGLQTAEKLAGSELTSAIPQALANLAAWSDKYERQPRTVGQEFEERIPGLRERVPVRTIREIYTPAPPSNLGGFSPIAVYPANEDTEAPAELIQPTVTLPKTVTEPRRGLHLRRDEKAPRAKLTPEEARVLQEQDEKELHSWLVQQMASPQWKTLTPDEKRSEIKKERSRITRSRWSRLEGLRSGSTILGGRTARLDGRD